MNTSFIIEDEEHYQLYDELKQLLDKRYEILIENEVKQWSETAKIAIICEFCEYDDVFLHIHYNNNNGGSKAFNELLDKYGFKFDWFDSCVLGLWKKQLKR